MLLRFALRLAHTNPRLRKPVVSAALRAMGVTRTARFWDPKPRPEIPGMVFPHELFEWLWYEDEDGNRIPCDNDDTMPDGVHSMHTSYADHRHSVFLSGEEGGPHMVGTSTWSDDVVTAMVRSGYWTAQDAIMAYGQACERCINVLAHHYGCDDGYPFGCEEYWKCNTCCEMCIPIAGDPHPNGWDE